MSNAKRPSSSNWRQRHPYLPDFGASAEGDGGGKATAIYNASCYCKRVKYEVRGDPESSKLCHCRGCQLLHGAPFEWVAIFHKHNCRFHPDSLQYLYFYSGERDVGFDGSGGDNDTASRPPLPLKVSCSHCRTPIADEGRHMWLAFATLFGFTVEGAGVPEAFRHSCHLFYGQRCMDLKNGDEQTKWTGHKNKSRPWSQNCSK